MIVCQENVHQQMEHVLDVKKNMYYPNPENPSECVECSTIENCCECMPDREYCTKCNTEWYADEGECWLCANITDCSKCSSDSKCIE